MLRNLAESKVSFTFVIQEIHAIMSLLPYRYKKIGSIIAPLGFVFWLLMQRGIITDWLVRIFGKQGGKMAGNYHIPNVLIAVISFFSFLAGMYLLAFSKEKIEDEMVQRIRLESFQFAALAQIICLAFGFLLIGILGDPDEGGLMMFFVFMIFLFWLCFIARFNYMLYIKLK